MSYVQRKNTTIKGRLWIDKQMNNIAKKFRLFLGLNLVYNKVIDKIYILSGWKLLSLLLITIYNNKVIAIHGEMKVITKHEV